MLSDLAPVIATDNGGSREALDNGNAGTLIPAADTDALASAISAALQNPAHLSRQVDYAETRAKERYSVARMQAQINEVIGCVAAEAR